MRPLVLASSSPQRLKLLRQIGFRPKVVPPRVDESLPQVMDPVKLVETLARRKAGSVALELADTVVIGADTMVLLDGDVIGKPGTKERAMEVLGSLSGREHEVLTGVAVVDCATGELKVGHERTLVCFRPLSQVELEAYIATREPLDKAGAYAIQGKGAALVRSVHGCYTNIVGLPLALVLDMLSWAGIHPFAAKKRSSTAGASKKRTRSG